MNREEQIAGLSQAASYLTSAQQVISLVNDNLKRLARQDLMLDPSDVDNLKERLEQEVATLIEERDAGTVERNKSAIASDGTAGEA